jgi:predicted nucleic acid-binding protein
LNVADSAVVNASPLIFFARAGCFNLLQTAGNTIFVPASVNAEILRRGSTDATVRAMNQSDWLNIAPDMTVSSNIQSWDLGQGESVVLSFAHANPGTKAIIDDLAARRCAAALNIPHLGSLGLVLRAKHRGIIAQARPILEKMVQNGMYLSPNLLQSSLALIDE